MATFDNNAIIPSMNCNVKTTKTKTKEKDKKVAVPPTGGGKNDGYTWKTGISIGPSSKK